MQFIRFNIYGFSNANNEWDLNNKKINRNDS